MIIKNKQEILSHGNIEGRKIALDLIESGINSINTYNIARKTIRVKNNILYIKKLRFNLTPIKRIFVFGGGKAAFPIAKVLEEVLNDKITCGVIVVKRGEKRRLKHIKVIEASHPIPDENGLRGAIEILNMASEVRKNDLVFFILTGGSSALISLPANGITLDNKRQVIEMLLKCGATVDEIHTVRRHISAIKGGRLAMRIHQAEIVNLFIMDEVSGEPWGPTVPDKTTFRDAIYVLKKYNVWRKIPGNIRNYLRRGLIDTKLETPKPKDFRNLRVHNVVLADNMDLCVAIEKKAKEIGLNSLILTTKLNGESREVGITLASIAKSIEEYGKPIKPPCIILAGGITTVKIGRRFGMGGPAQEVALGASLKISGSRKVVFSSIDTDGFDGFTDVAGGIVDGYTLDRAKKLDIDIFKYLIKHDSYTVLRKLRDTIITGDTETDVMDLYISIVMK